MDSAQWDERYAASDLVWSAEPNVFVAQVASGLQVGRALDLACGEGRNARWLASRGWATTAVDFSAVAIEKSRLLAEDTGVHVEWICADVIEWTPPSTSFDFVVLAYVHLPAPTLARVSAHAADALAPGGTVLVVGHARINLTEGTGGPQDPALLYEPDEVQAMFPGMRPIRAEHATRDVEEPDGTRQAIDTLVMMEKAPVQTPAQ